MMATLIGVDGTEREVTPAAGSSFTLLEMRDMIGGWIEVVGLCDEEDAGRFLVVDEDGKMKGLPINLKASLLYANPFDHIVGPALLVERRELGSDDTESPR
jgi:hypothetical protein